MTQPVDDILFRGPDTPPRRPGPVLGVAAVATALAFLTWQLAGNRPAATDTRPSPLPAPAISGPATPTPPASAVSAANSSAHRLPQPRRDVRPIGEPTGARLLLSGRSLVDISLDSGDARTTPVSGRILHSIPVRDGDVLLVVDPLDESRRAVFSRKERATEVLLGPARSIVPAADEEHVWLEVPSPPGTPKLLKKLTLSGRVVSTTDLGPWRAAIHETAHGMVTTSHSYFAQSLELWDIDEQRVARSYWLAANLLVVASNAGYTAFVLPYCDLPSCPMKLVDVRRGEVLDLQMPEHWDTNAAAFSPDGTRIAILGRQFDRGVAGDPVLVDLDLRSRVSRAISGVETLTSRSTLLTWSPDSRWFFAAAGPAGAPLLSYRVGERRVRYEPFPLAATGFDPADLTVLSAY